MSKLCTTAISLILLAAPAIAAEHTKDEAQKAVTEFTEHYQNLFNSKNTKGILDLYAKDGVEVAPGQPIMTSKADIEKRFERLFTNGATDLKYEVKQVEPPGKYVFAVGQFTVKESPTCGQCRGTASQRQLPKYLRVGWRFAEVSRACYHRSGESATAMILMGP